MLDPAIKLHSDAIYHSDPAKFKRLVVWIAQAKQQQFSNQVIVEALRRFVPYATEANPWWPYLDTILYKAEKDLNAAEFNARHKQSKLDMESAGDALRRLGVSINA